MCRNWNRRRRTPISALPFDQAVSHSAPTDELEEFAASYALGSLDADEATEFRSHISVCRVCRSLTAEFGATTDALPETLEPHPASAALKERVVAAAVATLPETSQSVEPVAVGQGTSLADWIKSLFSQRVPAAVAAVSIIAIGGLLAWNLALQFGGQDDETDLPVVSGQHLYNLAGTDASPGSSGAVFRVDENTGFLVLTDLPEPPAGHVYQVWRIKDGVALPENTFVPGGSNTFVVTVAADVADADTIGVNIEPEGGNEVPTGEVLLAKQS